MSPIDIPRVPGVYKITCVPTGKFYIGSATSLRDRWTHHRNDLCSNIHHNPKLQRAWNKYGPESFIFETLEFVLLPEMLTVREQHYLDTLKPWGNKGYNIALFAQSPSLGLKRTPETRAKIRDVKLGKSNHKLIGRKASPESRARMSAAQLGRQVSPEHREKLRVTHTGKKQSEEHIRKRVETQIGVPHSPETREKIRISNLGKKRSPETRTKLSAARTGSVTSPETKEKLRIAGLGRPMSPKSRALADARSAARRKTLIVTSPDGTEQTILGIRPFCREHHLNPSSLLGVAKGKCRHHKGWKARFPETGVE